jgi:hypothetical protein
MPLVLRQCLNKTVLVAIPSLFADAEARPCRVVALEAFGVWLVSNDLNKRVLPSATRDKGEAGLAVFVPFAQIAAIVPIVPPPATGAMKPAAAATPTPSNKTASDQTTPARKRTPMNKQGSGGA